MGRGGEVALPLLILIPLHITGRDVGWMEKKAHGGRVGKP